MPPPPPPPPTSSVLVVSNEQSSAVVVSSTKLPAFSAQITNKLSGKQTKLSQGQTRTKTQMPTSTPITVASTPNLAPTSRLAKPQSLSSRNVPRSSRTTLSTQQQHTPASTKPINARLTSSSSTAPLNRPIIKTVVHQQRQPQNRLSSATKTASRQPTLSRQSRVSKPNVCSGITLSVAASRHSTPTPLPTTTTKESCSSSLSSSSLCLNGTGSASDSTTNIAAKKQPTINFMSAFEQSLRTLNSRLGQLTLLIEKKDKEIDQLRDYIKVLEEDKLAKRLSQVTSSSFASNNTASDSSSRCLYIESYPTTPNQSNNNIEHNKLALTIKSNKNNTNYSDDNTSNDENSLSCDVEVGSHLQDKERLVEHDDNANKQGNVENKTTSAVAVATTTNEYQANNKATNNKQQEFNSLPEALAAIKALRRQLIEKDRLLTDSRLEALSAAHQLQELEDSLITNNNNNNTHQINSSAREQSSTDCNLYKTCSSKHRRMSSRSLSPQTTTSTSPEDSITASTSATTTTTANGTNYDNIYTSIHLQHRHQKPSPAPRGPAPAPPIFSSFANFNIASMPRLKLALDDC